MAEIEQTSDRLDLTIGWPWFNGSRAVFDRGTGLATIQGRSFFIPFTRTVPLADIVDVRYIRQKSAAYPRLHLASGRRIAMPSAGIRDAKTVVPIIQAFLGLP